VNETLRIPGYDERLLSVVEVAKLLGVSRPTVYRLVIDGELPVVKIRDRTLFRPTDVEALVERSTFRDRS
jgi:excisionase family DNA binding protein